MKNEIINAWRWIKKNPSGILVAASILFIGFYFLLWAIFEPVGIPDKFSELKFKRIFWHILISFNLALLVTIILEFLFRKTLWHIYSIKYESHNQDIGWSGWKKDGELSGSRDVGKRLEAIRIELGENIPAGISIRYQVHVQSNGWMDSKVDGQVAGTTGQSKRMEAIKICLLNAPTNYSVIYSIRQANNIWTQWYKDDEVAGTTGQSIAIEAIRIFIIKE